jgi:hypothetical protein
MPKTPITDQNIHALAGKWEGTWKGHSSFGKASGPATMEVLSTSPFIATLRFHESRIGDQDFALDGKIEDGFIFGVLRGLQSPSIKLGLHVNDEGRPELRGKYESELTRMPVTFDGKLELHTG